VSYPKKRVKTAAPITELVNLRAARIAAGMSQTKAGALIGKNQSHYAKIERGEVSLSAHEALRLCLRFELSIKALLVTAAQLPKSE